MKKERRNEEERRKLDQRCRRRLRLLSEWSDGARSGFSWVRGRDCPGDSAWGTEADPLPGPTCCSGDHYFNTGKLNSDMKRSARCRFSSPSLTRLTRESISFLLASGIYRLAMSILLLKWFPPLPFPIRVEMDWDIRLTPWLLGSKVTWKFYFLFLCIVYIFFWSR